ncbi:MAG TPA: hypothetical protein PKH40_00660 [Treponemataceae bacterium]|jgi:hypothetical protein|nr:MAG: hypothetical protein BWY39_00660 [Spirochaetes bacterium ADurb.Bin269]TAH46030.1 MAG: hypothetical protein EWM51_12255 [Treponema sp.]HOC28163.1 hypothetical protein [Treponemataceae bacterium]HPX47777.1 hypothetical protein [Treponemataceae bacterium]HQL32632.1 hypothetical protein [Treponemataceae bacterium]
MQIATIIPAAGLAVMPVLAGISLFRHISLRKELGAALQLFGSRRPLHFFGILLCMPLLISLTFIRDFDILTEIAITGTGLLGFQIALSDILSAGINGLYRHALVWSGEVIRYSAVESVTRLDPYSIEVILHPRARKVVSNSNTELIDAIFAKLELEHVSA